MRSDAPPLMPIFRSQHQAELLTVLLLHPGQDYTVTDLARRLNVPVSTLHREARRLVEADLVTVRTVGRARLLRANPRNRLVEPLTQLLIASFGPHNVVAEEFGDLANVDRLIIFGSWAARYHGTPGPPPADVDVLLVGRPTRAEVYEAADRAQQRLGLPVNPTVCSPTRWADPNDPFIASVRSSPMLDLTEADPKPMETA